MSNTFKPIADKVLVRALQEEIQKEEQAQSGLILVQRQSQSVPIQDRGEVIAIGPKVREISEGTIVMFPKASPKEISYEGRKYLLLRESDVLAVID